MDTDGQLWKEILGLAVGTALIVLLPVELPVLAGLLITGIFVGSASAIGSSLDGNSPETVRSDGLGGFYGGIMPLPPMAKPIAIAAQMIQPDLSNPAVRPTYPGGANVPYNPVPPTSTEVVSGFRLTQRGQQ